MLPTHVRPWSDADLADLANVVGVLTDIDDTLTTEGRIPMGVVAALAAMQAQGIPTIAVTGRPLGWSREVCGDLPLAATMAENGAVGLFPGGAVHFAQDEAERARNAAKLAAVAARVLREVPGATLARDSAGRVTDIAVDHAEFAHLDAAWVERVVALMRAHGMEATVSSIHVNGWFGTHTKASGARDAVRRLFDRELDDERGRWIYVGDSTNDQPMFERFPLSVGVANILDFADRLAHWPAYVTARPRGLGFVEVAERLLAARAVSSPAAAAGSPGRSG